MGYKLERDGNDPVTVASIPVAGQLDRQRIPEKGSPGKLGQRQGMGYFLWLMR